MEGVSDQIGWKRHAAVLLAVCSLSAAVQAWLILRAEVPSLDAVRFVRAAQTIDRDGLVPAVRALGGQPLFPAWVWVIHSGLTVALGEIRWAWAASVQLAAAIPLVLAAVPVYLLGVRLWGRAAGAAGAVLFCTLPEVARLGADGLSDSTHLLFAAVAVWAAVEGLRWRGPHNTHLAGELARRDGSRTRPASAHGERVRRLNARKFRAGRGVVPLAWLLAGGLSAGVAALARAEVLIVPAALLLALAAGQTGSASRRPWGLAVAGYGAFALGMALAVGPYLGASGAMTPGRALARLRGAAVPGPAAVAGAAGTVRASSAGWNLEDGRPMSFAPKDPATSLRRRGLAAAAPRTAGKLADALGYWVGALAVFGLWRARWRPLELPAVFLACLFAVFLGAALRFAAIEGYIEARHLVVLAAASMGAAGYGAMELGLLLARAGRDGASPLLAPLPAALAVAASLAAQAGPLHASRTGHREAAEWLAGRAPEGGLVIDTRGWTGLYSGLATRPYEDAPALLADPGLAFVVVEPAELGGDGQRGRTLRTLLDAAAERAAVFPQGAALAQGWQPVAVYRWDAARFRAWADRTAGLSEEASETGSDPLSVRGLTPFRKASEPSEDRYARTDERLPPHGGRGL